MSEFHVQVVKLGKVGNHPNADSLDITQVLGTYPCIVRRGQFKEGDLAVYLPIDSICPNTPQFEFLKESRRIKAKKLRGIFSMGLLVEAQPGWVEGQNVQQELGITKWEPELPKEYTMGTACHAPVAWLPEYTDIEAWRRNPHVLQDGETVVLTEKVHGANGRWVFHDGELWVGSHHQVKKFDPTNMWWKIADQYQLADKLSKHPDVIIYGEVYGNVQDLKYDNPKGIALRLFDARDANTHLFLNYDRFLDLAVDLGLPMVPELYHGPWSKDLLSMAEGPSIVPGANHVREGFVVRPVIERYTHMGRVILKHIGEGYLLRKGG